MWVAKLSQFTRFSLGKILFKGFAPCKRIDISQLWAPSGGLSSFLLLSKFVPIPVTLHKIWFCYDYAAFVRLDLFLITGQMCSNDRNPAHNHAQLCSIHLKNLAPCWLNIIHYIDCRTQYILFGNIIWENLVYLITLFSFGQPETFKELPKVQVEISPC